jgi:hypothetical protein
MVLLAGICPTSALIARPAIPPPLAAFAAARNEGLPVLAIDFTQATVVVPSATTSPERKALALLIDDVAARTLVSWEVTNGLPAAGPVIVLGRFSEVRLLLGARAADVDLHESDVGAEGYQIVTVEGPDSPLLVVAGRDARGVLFGAGRLLRSLHLGPARAGLLAALNVITTPRYPLRGHQLGYRPKVNSYSGWDLPQWDRYLRDLIIFGCNTIELLPPRTDDAEDSPHFPQPQLDMMAGMSRLAAEYGLDVWIWYPALDKDYGDPATVAFALEEWAGVFRALPRIDALLVPGGDPGHTPPALMFPLLEKQTANLRRFHPQAAMWLSPQGFNQENMEYFFRYLREVKPAWLKGVVFAPWIHMELAEFRRRVDANYPIRFYPDITHTKECQYPVADWDPAFALTQGREPICPRPRDMALILRLLQPHTIGAITYSEGVNDDVNKAVWSALSWNPDASVPEILRDYARVFLNERLADEFAAGLIALEDNWRGPLAENSGVDATLERFRELERRATPADLRNWRLQAALYRAYFDAYVRARLLYERELERQAMDALSASKKIGSEEGMRRATAVLERPFADPTAAAIRVRVFQFAEALFQSINYKSSVPLYRAVTQRRGANLDTLDYPLNNRVWLQAQFDQIRKRDNEADRLAALDRIVNWTDPGPGGFYDDLGNPAAQPHLVPGLGHGRDPAFIHTPLNGHFPADGAPLPLRTSWVDYIWGLNDLSITLRYTDLDPRAAYQVRVVYPRFPPPSLLVSPTLGKIRLRADDNIEIHPYIDRPFPVEPVTFDVPQAAIRDGKLTLTWNREPGLGGNGKGCDISEVWLIKKSSATNLNPR